MLQFCVCPKPWKCRSWLMTDTNLWWVNFLMDFWHFYSMKSYKYQPKKSYLLTWSMFYLFIWIQTTNFLFPILICTRDYFEIIEFRSINKISTMELSPLPVKRIILNDLQYFNKTDIKITIPILTIHASKCIIDYGIILHRSFTLILS